MHVLNSQTYDCVCVCVSLGLTEHTDSVCVCVCVCVCVSCQSSQAADESGGVLPQAIQRIAQMALAGYPEDSEAAKRSADQLAKHIFAERCNRARAAEIKDMVSVVAL